jgi:[ribosomal protein S5]-alanine N-acetyltransferase
MKTPTLESPRLILRPVTMADAPAIQRYFSNWEVIQHLSTGVPWPYPDDGAESFLRDVCLPKMAAGDAMVWAIVLKGGPGEAVGLLDYKERDEGMGHRGFWLATHLHGQGYMTEAVVAFQDYVFLELGIERIIVMNARSNPGSRRIKEKTGARFLEEVEIPHRSGDGIGQRWEVTREAWAALQSDR